MRGIKEAEGGRLRGLPRPLQSSPQSMKGIPLAENVMAVCTTVNSCLECGREIRTKFCCHSCARRHKHIKRKRLALEEVGGGCQVCGYNKCIDALHFHHIDVHNPTRSAINGTTSMSTLSDMKFWKELELCVLVCNRCHTEIELGVIECPESVWI